MALIRRRSFWVCGIFKIFNDPIPGNPTHGYQFQEGICPKPVEAVQGGSSNLSTGKKPRDNALGVISNLPKFTGRYPTHLVVGRWSNRAEIPFRINTHKSFKKGTYLLNPLFVYLFREVSQIQPHMMGIMTLVKKTSLFPDLLYDCPGDKIPGGKVFGSGRIAFHKGLFILIPENSSLSP